MIVKRGVFPRLDTTVGLSARIQDQNTIREQSVRLLSPLTSVATSSCRVTNNGI